MRFYRALLRLYPASFRNEYGDELTAVFDDQASRHVAIGAVLDAIADVVPSAAPCTGTSFGRIFATPRARSPVRPGFAHHRGARRRARRRRQHRGVLRRRLRVAPSAAVPHPDQLVKVWARTPGYSAHGDVAAELRGRHGERDVVLRARRRTSRWP